MSVRIAVVQPIGMRRRTTSATSRVALPETYD